MTVALLAMAIALVGGTAVASASPAAHPAGPPTPQRNVARQWVLAIDKGNQRAACELQAVPSVGGRPCAELPTGQILRCPKGASVKAPKKSELRTVTEQVGSETAEDSSHAFFALHGQRVGSKAQGALGLESQGGSWRVVYLRQGATTFAPAGTVWMSPSWRELWYPPTCSR